MSGHRKSQSPLTLAALSSTLLALTSCYAGQAVAVPDGGGYHWTTGTGAASGVPCDVAAILRRNCYGCHAGSRGGQLLLSYADLTAPSTRDPSKSVIQRSVDLMRGATPIMPPGSAARVPEADIVAIESWIAAGTNEGTCTDDAGAFDAGPNEYDTPDTCTTGTYWTGGELESWNMIPGGDCIGCHQRRREGPAFDIAGTVYPTAHELANCNGANGTGPDGAVVIITGADLYEFPPIPTNAVGNFGAWTPGLVLPYTARVEYQGRRRDMITPQTSGDCNVCHTLRGTTTPGGTSLAPGRIMLP